MRVVHAVVIGIMIMSPIFSMITGGAEERQLNRPPSADAGPDQIVYVNQTVYFDGSGSSDPDNDELNYTWDFDISDGFQEDAYGVRVTHTYTSVGEYRVTLRVSDGTYSDTDECVITVVRQGTNHAPVAVISSPQNGDVYNTSSVVKYDGSKSSDPDGDKLKYYWDFGDGNTSTGMYATHTYENAGVYFVTLTVNDSQLSDSDQVFINVLPSGGGSPGPPPVRVNTPPKADAGPNQTIYINQTVTFVSFSSDREGDKLDYYWDFNTDDGINFTNPDAEGQVVTHIYHEIGNYTVFHWVRENNTVLRLMDGDSCWVNVTPYKTEKPIASAGKDKKGKVGKKILLEGSGRDPDNDWIPDQSGNGIVLYEWDFDGDGKYDWSNKTTGRVYHVYNTPGLYVAVLRVIDDDGENSTDSVNITILPKENIPPTAEAGDDITIYEGEIATFDGIGSDEDGKIVLYEWDFEDDGVVDYRSTTSGKASHKYESSGMYTAVFRVTDDRNDTAEDSLIVRVKKNRAPVADAGGDQTVECGEEVIFDASDSQDPDKHDLRFMWDFDDRDGIGVDAEGETVAHVYEKGGVYTVTLTVEDELGATDIDNAIITVVQNYAVKVIVDKTKKSVKPLDSVSYSIKVVNEGNGKDIFDISISGENYKWGTLSAVHTKSLSPGESESITLTVTPPADSKTSDKCTIYVKATSQGDASATAKVKITTTILQTYSLEASSDIQTLTVEQGSDKEFKIRVKNTGNGEDYIKMSAGGQAEGWIEINPQKFRISAGSSKSVAVRISVPDDAKPTKYVLIITATSSDGKTSAMVKLEITVTEKQSIPFNGVLVLLMSLLVISIILRRGRNTT